MFRARLSIALAVSLAAAACGGGAAESDHDTGPSVPTFGEPTAAEKAWKPAPDKWDFYITEVNASPASIMVNFWFGGQAPMADRPELLWVIIDMDDRGKHGFGSAAEAKLLTGIEEAIAAEVQPALNAYLVGRIQSRGTWQLYFYAPSGIGFKRRVQSVMETRTGRSFRTGHRPDPNWTHYVSVLFPNKDRLQWMQDRRMVTMLVERGDALDPRPVDHWLYFKEAAQRDAFADSLSGFEIAEKKEEPKAERPFGVRIRRVDSVGLEHIHSVVMALTEAAAQHGGSYDGWETVVVKPEGAAPPEPAGTPETAPPPPNK